MTLVPSRTAAARMTTRIAFAFIDGCRLDHRADGLGDASLLANDAAHVVLRNGEVIHDDSVLIGLVHRNLYGVLVFHKAFGDC